MSFNSCDEEQLIERMDWVGASSTLVRLFVDDLHTVLLFSNERHFSMDRCRTRSSHSRLDRHDFSMEVKKRQKNKFAPAFFSRDSRLNMSPLIFVTAVLWDFVYPLVLITPSYRSHPKHCHLMSTVLPRVLSRAGKPSGTILLSGRK